MGTQQQTMAISDKNCARFEGIGFDLIRRELSVGDVTFLGLDKQMSPRSPGMDR